MFGFAMHGVILPLEVAMERPQHAYAVMNSCALLVAVVYAAFAGQRRDANPHCSVCVCVCVCVCAIRGEAREMKGYLIDVSGCGQAIWTKDVSARVRGPLCSYSYELRMRVRIIN